jgi:hypothetical protein
MPLVKTCRILINRMRHNAAHASELGSSKAAPQRIREQRRSQTAPACQVLEVGAHCRVVKDASE